MTVGETDLCLAGLADVLAEAVRANRVTPSDARRIIVHDLRRLNTNNKLAIHPRSVGAQAAIEKYAPESPPQNGSPDALHADHFGMPTKDGIAEIPSVEAWLGVIARVRQSAVCLTAAENYSLISWEWQGYLGHEKYTMAGIEFVDPVPWATATT
jgi:hypothetical protein